MKNKEQHKPKWAIPFFAIWTGQAFSLIGSSLAQFALVWWLTESTGSATVLATATLVALLPGVFLGPFAGALVDRWNRRVVMIIADSFVALVSAWLAYLFWVGAIRIWHVYIIMLARAIGEIFHLPAMQSSTSLMVPEHHLSRVAGLNQAMEAALRIVSPPLGAILLGLLPLHGIMAIDVVTAALAISPLFFVYIPQPERRTTAAPAGVLSLWRDVHEGLRYIWNWPGIPALLIMATVINFLFYPAFSLMPILVTRHFGGEALQLGWMNSALSAGIVLGGLVLSAWGGFRRRIVTTLMGLVGMGLGTLAIGLAPEMAFLLALAGIFITGFMNSITNGPIIALLQALVAPEIQGRVFTVMQSVARIISPLGMAAAGPVADALGVRVWYVMAGIVCLLMSLSAFRIPVIMHLEESEPMHKPNEGSRR
jgi:DHA3 family macrolide efflux protein-like MFS transporter